jgi:hypothetical protein
MEPVVNTNQGANSGAAAENIGGGSGCVAAMTALANGDFAAWRGLPKQCMQGDVEKVLSVATGKVNESNPYSGPLGYAPTPAAPHGITVHYSVGAVDYITVVAPQFRQPIQEQLGEPEGKIQSHLEGSREQWVYANLGLAFHMKAEGPGVNWLYVFGPNTLETYKHSLLSRMRTLRHPSVRYAR